jgi:hypothetical protein
MGSQIVNHSGRARGVRGLIYSRELLQCDRTGVLARDTREVWDGEGRCRGAETVQRALLLPGGAGERRGDGEDQVAEGLATGMPPLAHT